MTKPGPQRLKLVTSGQMRDIDSATIEGGIVPGPELMENAGRGIAENILHNILSSSPSEKVAVFCGKGNNGGDGLVIARHLYQAEVEVTVYFLGPVDKLSTDARLNFDRAAGVGLNLVELTSPDILPDQLECEYIIDALFGTGFTGAPRGLVAEIIKYINHSRDAGKIVVAVDMPSGLNADTGQHEGEVVNADYTFPLALPKYGLYVSPGRELTGQVTVIPIGIPDDVIDKFDLPVELITPELVNARLPHRKPDGHKGDFGKLLVLAGSTGLTGAAAMTAKSALRCGCGLVKVACPQTVLPTIASLAMEATLWPLPDVAGKGAPALRGLGEIRKLAAEHDVVIVGPGLGQHHETQELVRRFLLKLDRPVIVDADGLNALAGHTDLLREMKVQPVLTPHPGEFRRLTGRMVPPESEIHERIKVAIGAARDLHCVMVLKGSPTLVAEPNGTCYLNPTGNSGMATGGSGDVLSGAIGSFMAQGMSGLDAAVGGVYVHGLAGDFAAADLSQRCLIAGDLIDYLPGAFALLD
ncbi:MAG: NAD(P)H-hydrate dehydratase [bacterium]